MWSTAISLLKPLTDSDNPSAMAIYNIARMMEIRGRDAQAGIGKLTFPDLQISAVRNQATALFHSEYALILRSR